jgi:hypothetical protein
MIRAIAKLLAVAAAGLILAGPAALPAEKGAEKGAKKAAAPPHIEVAILLDTSGSMSGLIEQAKRQLWAIVNEFITAKKKGLRPELKVALYEYGNDGLSRKGGYIRLICALTDDLDKVSEELFALRTNGGSEYCGWVIKQAVHELKWSKSREDLKLIYIAGNEPFTQGPVDYRTSCKAAIAKGIIVNTIHCGDERTGIAGKWQDGARLAEGSYAVIDHNRTVVAVKAPQDKRIAELGAALNKTYVPYGAAGKAGAARQTAQDVNSSSVSVSNMAGRAVVKANAYYVNSSWDLVDAVNHKKVDLDEVKPEALPKNMRGMSAKQRREYVEKQSAARREIQKEINKLNAERSKYVAAEMKKRAAAGKDSLGESIRKSARAQASARNFKF